MLKITVTDKKNALYIQKRDFPNIPSYTKSLLGKPAVVAASSKK